VLTQEAKELIALVAAMVVLVGAAVAYSANTYPTHYAASKGGQGKDDSLIGLFWRIIAEGEEILILGQRALSGWGDGAR
jgi:hypothetical protein